VRQTVIATLGRTDDLAARGALASLLASGARFCDQVMLLSTLQADLDGPRLLAKRVGPPLLFGRLWEQSKRRGGDRVELSCLPSLLDTGVSDRTQPNDLARRAGLAKMRRR
jgi:hypothetical protein